MTPNMVEKVSLQTSLERNLSNIADNFLLDVKFVNLIVVFHVLYILNMQVKFHSNRILFSI